MRTITVWAALIILVLALASTVAAQEGLDDATIRDILVDTGNEWLLYQLPANGQVQTTEVADIESVLRETGNLWLWYEVMPHYSAPAFTRAEIVRLLQSTGNAWLVYLVPPDSEDTPACTAPTA